MKRHISILLAVLLTFSLGAISTASADAEPVEIEMWHIWPADEGAEKMTSMIEKFVEENPNVTVKELGISFWDYNDKLTPALAANTGPDLMVGDLGNPKARAMNGQIMNLEPYVQETGFNKDLYFPASIEQCSYEGELYAFPFITDTRVLYWNKDHFAEAGLDPEKPPVTWEEMIEYNDKLTTFKDDERTEVERMGFSTRIGNFYEWTLGWTYGAELFNEDNSPNVNSPEMLEALNTALTIQNQVGLSAFDAYNEGTKSLTYSPFIGETLSMVVETNGFYSNIQKYNPEMNFGVTLIPTSNGVDNKASWGNGHSLEIADKGDAAKSRAAFDLGAFLCRTDNALSFVTERSEYVCNVEALNDPSVVSDPVWQVLAESGNYVKFRPFIPEYPTWYSSLTPEWEAALKGEKSPEQALSDAQDRIIEEIENYRLINAY